MRIEWRRRTTVLFAVCFMAIATLAASDVWAQEAATAVPEEVVEEAEALPPEPTFTLPTGEEEEPVIEDYVIEAVPQDRSYLLSFIGRLALYIEPESDKGSPVFIRKKNHA